MGGTDDALMVVCGWRSPAMAYRYRKEHAAELAIEQYGKLFGEQPTQPRFIRDGSTGKIKFIG